MTPATFMVKAEVLPMSRKTLMFSPNAAASNRHGVERVPGTTGARDLRLHRTHAHGHMSTASHTPEQVQQAGAGSATDRASALCSAAGMCIIVS